MSALPPIPPLLLPDPPKLPPVPELLEPPDPPVPLLPEPPKPPFEPPELPGLPLLPPRLPLWPVPLGFTVSFSMLRSLSGMQSPYGQLRKRMSHAHEDYFRLLRELLARSPLSPCPERTERLALCFRSWLSERPTSSDSLNFPWSSRRTNLLSPSRGSMSSLFDANAPPRFWLDKRGHLPCLSHGRADETPPLRLAVHF